MSDPVTNAEVEDVLSSIRRLVSEDKRPMQPKAKPVMSDRLVLTPALRVADAEASEPAQETPEATVQDWSEEDAAFEAAYGDEDTQADESHQPMVLGGDEPTADALEDPALDYETDPYNFADDTDEDGEGGLTYHRDTALFDPEPTDCADQTAPQSGPDTTPHAGIEDAPAAAHDGQAATLSAKIAALETAIGNIPENWEPDGAVEDDYSGTDAPAMAWEDDAESAATTARLHNLPRNHRKDADAASFFRDREAPEAARAPEKESKTEDERFAFSDDDQLLDEEALRDLVSEIVRAELQGALGERITRNVRKLVRREIHRALTAQELE